MDITKEQIENMATEYAKQFDYAEVDNGLVYET